MRGLTAMHLVLSKGWDSKGRSSEPGYPLSNTYFDLEKWGSRRLDQRGKWITEVARGQSHVSRVDLSNSWESEQMLSIRDLQMHYLLRSCQMQYRVLKMHFTENGIIQWCQNFILFCLLPGITNLRWIPKYFYSLGKNLLISNTRKHYLPNLLAEQCSMNDVQIS